MIGGTAGNRKDEVKWNKYNYAELPGFSFRQVEDLTAGTGCTVILCPDGAVTGVDVRGGSRGRG